jgi:hypothetical protein
MRSLARLVTAVLVTSLAAAGCAAPGPSATDAPPPPTSTVAPTDPPATPAPTATPSAEPTGPLSLVDGDLPAGSYLSSSMGLDISFDLGPGWQGFADIPDVGFALLRPEVEGGVTVTHFGGEVFSEACSSAATVPLETSAEAFVAWLATHPELRADEPAETTLGGHPAIQIDLTSDVGEPCPDTPRNWLWALPVVGDFHLNEDEAARFIVADIGERTVVVVIETFGMTGQDEQLALAEPFLASMVIEP